MISLSLSTISESEMQRLKEYIRWTENLQIHISGRGTNHQLIEIKGVGGIMQFLHEGLCTYIPGARRLLAVPIH